MIFSKEIIPMCLYCEHGTKIIATDDIICAKKKGIVKPDFSCKKFTYTPINRIPPKKAVVSSEFSKEDFEF